MARPVALSALCPDRPDFLPREAEALNRMPRDARGLAELLDCLRGMDSPAGCRCLPNPVERQALARRFAALFEPEGAEALEAFLHG